MECGRLVYACTLSRIFNYDCNKAKKMVEMFPSIEAIFSLSRNELNDIFYGKSHYPDEILNHSHLEKSIKEVKWAESHNIRIFYIGDNDYPSRLKECNDAPIVLYYKGTSDLNASRILSIVGTRHPTDYGKESTKRILSSLALLDPKPIIVSGLAYGIDITAHTIALDLGMDTIGVMATGLDTIYPSHHRNIAAHMVGKGGILSDFPSGTTPLPINFVRRNRIIAGLADATLLVESTPKGGGMISAKMAASYSREVFAIPGKITDKYSEGCNLLIGDTIANIVLNTNTIPRIMGWQANQKKRPINPKVFIFESDSLVKRKILLALSSNPVMDKEDIIECIDDDYQDIIFGITELEMEGRIRMDIYGKYTLL